MIAIQSGTSNRQFYWPTSSGLIRGDKEIKRSRRRTASVDHVSVLRPVNSELGKSLDCDLHKLRSSSTSIHRKPRSSSMCSESDHQKSLRVTSSSEYRKPRSSSTCSHQLNTSRERRSSSPWHTRRSGSCQYIMRKSESPQRSCSSLNDEFYQNKGRNSRGHSFEDSPSDLLKHKLIKNASSYKNVTTKSPQSSPAAVRMTQSCSTVNETAKNRSSTVESQPHTNKTIGVENSEYSLQPSHKQIHQPIPLIITTDYDQDKNNSIIVEDSTQSNVSTDLHEKSTTEIDGERNNSGKTSSWLRRNIINKYLSRRKKSVS